MDDKAVTGRTTAFNAYIVLLIKIVESIDENAIHG